MMSIYGSMEIGNKFYMENKVYKSSQKPADYLAPDPIMAMK
jgi:hypothetical protein